MMLYEVNQMATLRHSYLHVSSYLYFYRELRLSVIKIDSKNRPLLLKFDVVKTYKLARNSLGALHPSVKGYDLTCSEGETQ
jgi:hypothetical protein